MLRHSVRSAGRAARAQVHFKVTVKKRHRAHCRFQQGLRGAAAGTSRVQLPGTCRQVSCPAGHSHSPSWLPYPQWWDMVRGPALPAEAVTAPWPQHALRSFYRLPPTPCPSLRPEKGWGVRARAEGDSAGGGESGPL